MTAAALRSRRELFALSVLFAIGCALLAFVAAAPWTIRSFGYGVFIPAAAASGFLTIAATRFSADAPVRVGLSIVLGFALATRLLLVGEEPFLSTDLYRYIWDGRVQAAGINPYRYVPADPALAALRDAA
jgi:alpha-1,6-mannosyltransferase